MTYSGIVSLFDWCVIDMLFKIGFNDHSWIVDSRNLQKNQVM